MDDHYVKREYPKTKLTVANGPATFGFIVKKDSKDVNPLTIGKSELSPGAQAPTHCPNSVHLFFSCKGSGSFKLDETWYHVKEHEFFVLPSGTVTLLCADFKTGWTYRWISFTGTLSHDFLTFPTVFSLPEEFIATLYDPTEPERNLSSRLSGDLFHIHAKMYSSQEKEADHIQKVINRINISYMEKLTVAEIAKDLGLDRSHLSRLFKSRMGITIQDYLLHFRITKAKQYLLKGFSVSDTAQLCGFGERINFSRAFLKETGIRPTEWSKYIKKDSYNRPR